MKIFNIGGNISIICESVGNRSGFKHVATVMQGGRIILKDKIQYYNRTWESWQFESILGKVERWIDNNVILENPQFITIQRGQACRA